MPGYMICHWQPNGEKKFRLFMDADDARNFVAFRMAEGDHIEITAQITVLVHAPRAGKTWRLETDQRAMLESLIRNQVQDPPASA